MSLKSMGRNAMELVRREGLRAVPHYAYTKFRIFQTRDAQQTHSAARARNEAGYNAWLMAQQPDAAERKRQHNTAFSHRLSFLIPTYNTEPALLAALVDSLLAQTTDAWEACFYDGCSPREDTRQALKAQAARDPRICVELGTENLGIAGNTNRALVMAQNDWVALVDHDDLLTPDAAYCVLHAAEQGADMVYSDEDKCSADGTHFFDPHLKSDFAPDTLRAGNYICHLMAMEKALMERVGALRAECDGSQDHDLALRASEQARKITHIRRILYHWRMLDTSESHQRVEKCALAAARAVDDQLKRLHLSGHAESRDLQVHITYDLHPEDTVTVIAVCDAKGTQRWLRRLARVTPEHPVQVLLIGAEKEYTFQGQPCERMAVEGGLSDTLNAAVQRARGTFVLFLHQGVLPMKAGWLSALQMYAQRSDVSCAGTALMTPGKLYLHAGYAVGVPSVVVSHHAGVSYVNRPYMLTDRLVRNVTAVSGEEMMLRRETFLRLGGFESYASDLRCAALGLRAQEAGLLNVYVPDAAALWHGAEPPCLTAPPPTADAALFRASFSHPVERYYSPLFDAAQGQMLIDLTKKEPEA